MSDVVIEKGIPLKGGLTKDNGLASIIKKLEIGDSFLWDRSNKSNFHSSARYIGFKIASRKQPDGRYRIWRIA